MLDATEDDVIEGLGVTNEELLPIGVTTDDMDLFLMTRPQSQMPGQVIWLAGCEIERFSSFTDYFHSMIDYNIEGAEKKSGGKAVVNFKHRRS